MVVASEKFNLKAYLAEKQALVEAGLDRCITVTYPETVSESMRYSLLAGGKRLRPILCLATAEMLGGTVESAMPTACALEMVHTMSLIHDDLPSMDNDDFRRGKPTNHKVYGEAVAILAGDGLLSYAFEYVAAQTKGVPTDRILKVVIQLGQAFHKLVCGQVVDLMSEGKSDMTPETLTYIHNHKTSALLEVSVLSGAILAGATDADQSKLLKYSKNIGLAFQIVDDILDITATTEELGKSAGKDLTAEKLTYPKLWGLDESRRQADKLVAEAKDIVSIYGEKSAPLMAIADYITARKN
ncbi:polyprenyl synthetase family protein [filamentous cyanobacterium LEGE 11480]|uniref:dimethylallyltranstransferase n=1 Tax=Romeriopsis navalis LEGE 11480 TaxID=2777977 RepID=A0A928Z2W6_9CYAN|nr:farnesyl diphosphate synthase [Romeriopsis navalis]MBE9028563.1 polyprenyl synthetase family protein [Romeriopsis navalis LEGE 11480]